VPPASELILWITTGLALLVGLAGIIKDRRTPELNQAQATSALADSDQVKAEIKRLSEQSNMARDLRILDLEKWGDAMRPWASSVMRRDNQMLELIKEDRVRCNLPMPELEPLMPYPEFPAPRPLPS
jgi:hypothetical protein